MGKGKRSREPGTKRRTILQIDSNKIARSSDAVPPTQEEVPSEPEPIDDPLADFLKEISALEEENKLSAEKALASETSAVQSTAPSNNNDAQASDQTELPEGWQRILDPTTGYHYYWCVATNKTSWEYPSTSQPNLTETPAGLSLISTYSESDSEGSITDISKLLVHKECDKDSEMQSTTTEDQNKVANTVQQYPAIVQQTTATNQGYEAATKLNSFEYYKPITSHYRNPQTHTYTQTDESAVKPTDDALRPLIQQLAAEVKHKLEFLGINLQQVNQLQGMLIELETRVSDWRAGYLPSEYTLTRLQESTRMMREYEQSAAPMGWGCTWDPSQQKYQYIQTSSGKTVWEYPAAVPVCSEVLEDDDMVLSGSEDGECPPLPPLPPSPTSGPPPPPNELTNQSLSMNSPPQPVSLQQNNPPLPDLPPSESSSPPPLPINHEAYPPPLPPTNSPPLPCPDLATPPLPPSEHSSNMSHSPASRSPSTKPNSPYPPLEQEISSSTHQITSQYYFQSEQQQHPAHTYHTPITSTNCDSYNQAIHRQHQYAVTESVKSPRSSGKSKGRKSNSGGKKVPPSTLATHTVTLKKKGMADMLEKWRHLHSKEEVSSESSESEIEADNNMKEKIADWKREQLTSGKARENANFQNIHGNWKDKIKRAKTTSSADSSLLHLSGQTEG